MHPSRVLLLFGALVSTSLVPACLDDTAGKDYHAAGQHGAFALGWAYDGKNVMDFDGFITIHANPVSNTGDAEAHGRLNKQNWTIRFDHFAEQAGKPFQDGGIAAGLDEHGDTNVGDSSIPKVHADMAAWGDALVTVDGKDVPDALTGDARWVAHYMVITTGVRDDATKGIWNADKSVPYDPKNPSNGLALEGDSEIHLVLKSHATAPPNATAISFKANGPASVRETHPVENKYQNSEFNASVRVSGTFAPVQRISFVLKDPNGKTVASMSLPEGNRMEGKLSAVLPQVGKYTLETSGSGVQPAYEVTGALTPPTNVVMNFWWEDVLFGQAAAAFEETADAGHSHEGSGNTTLAPKAF